MYLQQLDILNYRNYQNVHLDFHPRFNLINGLNGMGKTNLLDAIYYLAITKSSFFNTDRHNFRDDEDFFRLDGRFLRQSKKQRIVAKVEKAKKKIFEKNKKAYEKLSDHVGYIPVVMIAPKDQDLIYDGSTARRRFLDNTISQLDGHYLQALIQYNHHLKQRNAYLKQLERPHHLDQALLHIYNDHLVQTAQIIFEKRNQLALDMTPLFEDKYQQICENTELCTVAYKSQLHDSNLGDLLIKNQDRDVYTGRTSAGIHKDDIVFQFGDSDLKNMGSQGQQKSFVLALKLAQYSLLNQENNVKPIVLLDDIFDKLDHRRVMHLIQLLQQMDAGQIFISDTEENRLTAIFEELKIDSKQFIVVNGEIKETYETT